MRRVNRRQFLQTAAAAATAAPFMACARNRRPNVVFILSDDLRWDCMSAAGHPFLETPNIDRIANEGIRFSNAFCTTSLCSPSRASFLSGLYAHQHQVINNFTEFPSSITSYPQRLHENGYHTAYIGKWHMGEGNDEKRPGFDYWASHKGQGQYYDTAFNVDGNRQTIKGYYSHVVTNLATEWLKTARRPFSLNLGHKAPHGLWIPEMDVAPSVLDLCGVAPLTNIHGASFKGLAQGQESNWRKSWMYEYNFENEFPYTPNVRGVRTDEWSYMHYPNGEGLPDTEKAELYNVKKDPLQKDNLIDAPDAQGTANELKAELLRIQKETGGLPDKMPISPQLRFEMPNAAIR